MRLTHKKCPWQAHPQDLQTARALVLPGEGTGVLARRLIEAIERQPLNPHSHRVSHVACELLLSQTIPQTQTTSVDPGLRNSCQ